MINMVGLQCCGVKEISGLSDYESAAYAMQDFWNTTYGRKVPNLIGNNLVPAPMVNFRYCIFTQARHTYDYGIDFAKFITNNKLGTIAETDFNTNPNSGNDVKVWIWTIDHNALGRWKKK